MAQRRPDVISQRLPYYLPTYFQLLDLRWRFTVGLYPIACKRFINAIITFAVWLK